MTVFVGQWLSHVQSLVILWTVAHQAHMSMLFPRLEHWHGLPFPSPGDLPDLGNKFLLLHQQVGSLPHEIIIKEKKSFAHCKYLLHLQI